MQSWQLVAKCIAMTIGDSSSAYSLEITLWFSLPTFLAQSRCFGRIFKRKNEKWGCGNQHYCNTKRQIHLSCLWFAGTLKFPCSLKVFPFEPRVGSIPPPIFHCPLIWRQYGGNYNEVELLKQTLSTIESALLRSLSMQRRNRVLTSQSTSQSVIWWAGRI